MTRKKFDIALEKSEGRANNELYLYEIYTSSLESRITELEATKSCEGCEYINYPNRFNALKTCKECYRS